ncbi:MAG: biotin/lipoyl-binding protein [Bacteroidetes bacterium]|nr:biotin/lipoyl-binding protein [Bacteroidota bacterium]
MSINQYVSSDLFESDDETFVTIGENLTTVNGIEMGFSIEQEFPLVVNITKTDGLISSFVVKLDSKGKAIISHCGYTYPLEVLSEKEYFYNQILLSGKAGKSTSTKIPAPMPGLIKSISISNGQIIKKGETLFVLEAMKMENSIKSPIAGKVTNINVQEGIAVDKNTVLCIVEPIKIAK